jgi:hypothetical protein
MRSKAQKNRRGKMKKSKFPIKKVSGLIAVVIILYIGISLFAFLKFGHVDNAGVFGDMFGAVNALFSGGALLGVILTIFMQIRELEYQREELELTRNEIKGQKVEMEQQTVTFQFQRFESNFFNLLRTFNDILSSTYLRKSNTDNPIVIASGRDCFAVFYQRLKSNYDDLKKNVPQLSQLELIQKAYMKFYNKDESKVGHYFRHLYNIIKFIDESTVIEKQFYVNIIRSQLCINELVLLFYNCVSPFGVDKFKPFVEKYALLEGFEEVYLFEPSHKTMYSDSAYKEGIN